MDPSNSQTLLTIIIKIVASVNETPQPVPGDSRKKFGINFHLPLVSLKKRLYNGKRFVFI